MKAKVAIIGHGRKTTLAKALFNQSKACRENCKCSDCRNHTCNRFNCYDCDGKPKEDYCSCFIEE